MGAAQNNAIRLLILLFNFFLLFSGSIICAFTMMVRVQVKIDMDKMYEITLKPSRILAFQP
jgi:hypothetical protein